jgi:glycosyltransferase involved in cell wall biosynthesis
LNQKLGKDKNSAGLVRNIGIEKIKTDWIGFVDDDDTLSAYYVTRLKEELIRSHKLECVIFRMIYTSIMPLPHQYDFFCNFVGISFCYKMDLFREGYKFVPGSGEDYDLLNRLRNDDKKILISPYVTYKVRHCKIPANINMIEQYSIRAIIN